MDCSIIVFKLNNVFDKARVECKGHPLVKFYSQNQMSAQAITLGLIERLTNNADWESKQAQLLTPHLGIS
jgi:hypothetical protein